MDVHLVAPNGATLTALAGALLQRLLVEFDGIVLGEFQLDRAGRSPTTTARTALLGVLLPATTVAGLVLLTLVLRLVALPLVLLALIPLSLTLGLGTLVVAAIVSLTLALPLGLAGLAALASLPLAALAAATALTATSTSLTWSITLA